MAKQHKNGIECKKNGKLLKIWHSFQKKGKNLEEKVQIRRKMVYNKKKGTKW